MFDRSSSDREGSAASTQASLPSWLSRSPMIEAVRAELRPPCLGDNTADLDRLTRMVKQEGFSPLVIPPRMVGPAVQAVREGEFKVTALLAHCGCHWELLDALPGFSETPILGVAVDIGTSSLALYLLDLERREIMEEEAIPNPQALYGDDILSRILFAREPKNRALLKQVLVDAMNRSMERMTARAGLSTKSILAVSAAGNTTMTHMFLGLDPASICREPYIPAVNRFPFHHARDLDLAAHPSAVVYLFPNVASYFGGDLIADILAAGLHKADEPGLLVDVGTNAEVVLGNSDWLVACAGAAGPALEGGVIERGMKAGEGAIDRVRIDLASYEPSFTVIGGVPPKGICGSGVIDLVAEMFQAGILTVQGKINREIRSGRIRSTPDGPAYALALEHETADGRDLLISEIDIGIFLKSKAAMYTILTVITSKVGLHLEDIRRFFVAGAFGHHIDPEMAIRIGMLPDLPIETFCDLGNTAGLGAAMVLLDRTLLAEIERVCDRITYIELNVDMQLMNEFRGALFLPHTDPGLFPSVRIPGGSKGEAA